MFDFLGTLWGRIPWPFRGAAGPTQAEKSKSKAVARQTADEYELAARWNPASHGWLDHLRASPLAVGLHDWLRDPLKYQWLMGEDGYREQIAQFLRDASYEDGRAAGIEYSKDLPHYGTYSIIRGQLLRILWCPSQRRSAILWGDGYNNDALWVDGHRVRHEDVACVDSIGHWIDDRYFVVAASGPTEHPNQTYGFGIPELGEIQSLLIYDVDTNVTRVEHPAPDQCWTSPCALYTGGSMRLFASQEAKIANRPDRIVPLP